MPTKATQSKLKIHSFLKAQVACFDALTAKNVRIHNPKTATQTALRIGKKCVPKKHHIESL